MPDAKDTARTLRKLAKRLDALADDARAGTASRDALEAVVTELRTLLARHFGPRPRALHGSGARAKILAHLKANVGQSGLRARNWPP